MLVNYKKRYMLNQYIKNLGLSLIELMMAVVILGILTVLAFPQYTLFMQNQQIRNTAESIQNGLQKAKAEAIKRNTWVQFVLGNNGAWTIECHVVVTIDGDGDGQEDCPAIIETRLAKDGSSNQVAAVADPATTTTVIFNSLGLVQTTAPTASPITAPFNSVVVENPNASGTRQLEIRLGTGSSIRMCDPDKALADKDPRRC